jgi:hypothetical protein
MELEGVNDEGWQQSMMEVASIRVRMGPSPLSSARGGLRPARCGQRSGEGPATSRGEGADERQGGGGGGGGVAGTGEGQAIRVRRLFAPRGVSRQGGGCRGCLLARTTRGCTRALQHPTDDENRGVDRRLRSLEGRTAGGRLLLLP